MNRSSIHLREEYSVEAANSAKEKAQLFVAFARALKGAKWRHCGRKPWAVDCIGLVVLSLRAVGEDVKDVRGYAREPHGDTMKQIARDLYGQPVTDWRPGDIALIAWGREDLTGVGHVGIIGNHPDGGLSLIHAHNVHGVIEHSIGEMWKKNIAEVFRIWK